MSPIYKDVYVAFTDGLSGTDTAYAGTGAYYFMILLKMSTHPQKLM